MPLRVYIQMAADLKANEKQTLSVDFYHISSFQFQDPHFLESLLQEYERFEPYLRMAVTMFLTGQGYPPTKNLFYRCAIFNLPQLGKIRDLKTNSIGKLMSIQGTVTRTTEVKPELIVADFLCESCKAITTVEQSFRYTEPNHCSKADGSCQNTQDWSIMFGNSIFTDWQKIRV